MSQVCGIENGLRCWHRPRGPVRNDTGKGRAVASRSPKSDGIVPLRNTASGGRSCVRGARKVREPHHAPGGGDRDGDLLSGSRAGLHRGPCAILRDGDRRCRRSKARRLTARTRMGRFGKPVKARVCGRAIGRRSTGRCSESPRLAWSNRQLDTTTCGSMRWPSVIGTRRCRPSGTICASTIPTW